MPEPLRAFYDFGVSPYSYDFLAFICQARSFGCTETVFVPGVRDYQKCTPEQQKSRLHNLLIPLARMSGTVVVCETRDEAKKLEPATFPRDYTVARPTYGHMFGQLIKSGRARWLSPSAEALKRAPAGKVTITIRESEIKPLRNSQIGEWIEAANWMRGEGYEPLFVPDTDNREREFADFPSCPEAAMDPDFRCALYAKSRLNLGIGNGPMGFCFYSTIYPYLMFRMHDERFQEQSELFMKMNSLPIGSQAPWRKGNQALVWEDDKAEIITRHIQRWELRKAA